jgi:acyl-CoA thioesterase FadM
MTDEPAPRRVSDRCSAPFRVRFDEAGPDGLLRTSVLLRYAQDLAWFHSASEGFDRDWYRERGLAWLVRAAEVWLDAPVRVGDALTGTTLVVGWRRVWARRRTEFVDASGVLVARANIDWVLLDARGAPIRIPPEFAIFGVNQTTFPMTRVVLGTPPADADVGHFTVRPQELDSLAHVNNAVYLDWLEERVIAAGGESSVRALPREARLEYVRAAERDAAVQAWTWRTARDDGPSRDDGTWACRIVDEEGNELLRASLEG